MVNLRERCKQVIFKRLDAGFFFVLAWCDNIKRRTSYFLGLFYVIAFPPTFRRQHNLHAIADMCLASAGIGI